MFNLNSNFAANQKMRASGNFEVRRSQAVAESQNALKGRSSDASEALTEQRPQIINTQEVGRQRNGAPLGSTIRDNRSAKSLVSGISFSVRTGTAKQ